MRLLVRKVYRAFPELDSYSDEQCSRFVRAAKRGFFRGVIYYGRLGLSVLIAAWCVAGVSWAAALTLTDPTKKSGSAPEILGAMSLVVVGIPALAAVWYLRDWLLRRRIGFVLRARGKCDGCAYSLIGLPVGPKTTVICPECGHETIVEEALGELTIDEAGRRRFIPGDPPGSRRARVHKRDALRRRRRFGRVVRWSAVVLTSIVVFLAAAAGLHEWRIRAQADIAKSAWPTDADFQAIYDQYHVADPSSGKCAVDVVRVAMTKARAVEASLTTSVASPSLMSTVDSGPYTISVTSTADLRSITDPDSELAKCIRLVDALAAGGVYAEFEALVGSPHRLRSARVQPPLADFRDVQTAVQIGFARLRLAVVRDDPDEFARALRICRELVRTAEDVPVWSTWEVARADRIAAARLAIQGLGTRPSPEWISAASSDWWADSETALTLQYFKWHHLRTVEGACELFSDPGAVRVVFPNPALNFYRALTIRDRWSLGSFDETRQSFAAILKEAEVAATFDPIDRSASSLGPLLPGPAFFSSRCAHELTECDYLRAMNRGIVTLLAVERFRQATGQYPGTLRELVPSQLASLPVDPWTSKPFCFKRVDPATDQQKRSFILYSVGKDGKDNGGIEAPYRNQSGVFDAPGFDVMINTNSE